MQRYNPSEIEPKWQKIWNDTKLYETPVNPGEDKYYCLVMFPYPSGNLHIGHWYNFGPADTVARYNRMIGKKLLNPIGFDAFGLPAENAAIRNKTAPAKWTSQNIQKMLEQFQGMGAMYDMAKTVDTSSPEYYRWTQWIFLKLYENDLAYKKLATVNWCPSCLTVLANEQVVGDHAHCERCDTPVVQKELSQWYFKITDYAQRLLNDLDELDWPQRVKTMQTNWIGKSVGAEVIFKIDGVSEDLKVFTTRPDTLFGATYMVLAPEHPLVDKITVASEKSKVKSYKAKTNKKSELERKQEAKDKTGAFTGAYAINPVNNAKIPIWISDYVLMSYGTGAIMAVPAHDQRDYEFASKFKIPIINVINPVTGEKQIDPVTKNKIVCVVEDKNGKILTNNWKPELGGRLLIGGTIEDGESPVDAAMREVIEETGYEDLELVGVSDETVYHEYYAFSKKTPTRAITKLVHLRIKSSAQVDITHEVSEMGNFEVQWVDKEMAFKEIYDEQHLRALDLFVFDKVYTGEGIMVNSGKYDDMNSSEMREKITTELTKKKQGNEKVNYKIHDWLISRQRYWGTPIPIIHCDKCGEVPVDYQDLPVRLPEDVEFEPTGQSPLLKITDFVNTFCPKCGGPAKRETDTMDTFVDSSWYYLRYPNPNYTKGPFDPEAVKTWLPVDHYIGGIEHAILHLLYSRFITKVLHDYAKLPIEEPFKKLTNQGMILGPDGQKMSKSKGNVVDPDEQVGSYGSDSLRLYMMFMGPFDQGGAYDLGGIAGTRRFIDRVWTLVTGLIETTEDTLASSKQNAEVETRLLSELNKTVKKVTHDLERLSFNTAIAFMMEFVNTANKILPDLTYNAAPVVWKEALMTLLRLMAPFVPHVSEELWAALGQEDSIHSESWPAWDDELVKDEMITIVVQVNGRVRANLLVASGTDMKEIVDIATKEPSVKQYLKQGTLQKTIEVANKLINFVVS